jgi:ketosteroid isomerase-like protein
VVPPRQYVGAAAYCKDWQDFLGSFDGPITVELTDLDILADRNLAYSHSIQRVAGTDKQGKKLDLIVRVTGVYKKARGRWHLIHEHVSVPVDLAADKPDLSSSRNLTAADTVTLPLRDTRGLPLHVPIFMLQH